jgi:hypothetical protein
MVPHTSTLRRDDKIDTELAWAAGFFDGEGSTWLSKDTVRYRHPVMAVGQSGDTEPLERFGRAVGVGKVYGPLAANTQGFLPDGTPRYYLKPRFQWRAAAWPEVSAALEGLMPYLSSVKVRQALDVLFRYSDSRETQARLRVGKDDRLGSLIDLAAKRLNALEEV